MFIGNIVNIVQHSQLYNSFLLIIVACIVILLELYYIGIMLASASSNEKAFQNNIKSII
jgi:hypothetical protein